MRLFPPERRPETCVLPPDCAAHPRYRHHQLSRGATGLQLDACGQCSGPSMPGLEHMRCWQTREAVECNTQVFGDAEYLQSVLGMLPGVDPSDPAVLSTLRSLRDGGGDREEDGASGDKQGQQ